MIDWQSYKQILVEFADAALTTFLDAYPIDSICAVGFVFELWNETGQFDICANTSTFLENTISTSTEQWPDLTDNDEIRWNSGDFEFPAGLP